MPSSWPAHWRDRSHVPLLAGDDLAKQEFEREVVFRREFAGKSPGIRLSAALGNRVGDALGVHLLIGHEPVEGRAQFSRPSGCPNVFTSVR